MRMMLMLPSIHGQVSLCSVRLALAQTPNARNHPVQTWERLEKEKVFAKLVSSMTLDTSRHRG
jgi:hypothetical protein